MVACEMVAYVKVVASEMAAYVKVVLVLVVHASSVCHKPVVLVIACSGALACLSVNVANCY